MTNQTAPVISYKPMYWLALGAFAIGTEGFMIAPLLPGIAADMSVTSAEAGQLITAFALAYALSSPILTTLTGSINRRRLLIGAMSAFAVANVLAWMASDYWMLMAARILLAFTAGLYLPGANAVAGALVPPEQRGRTIAIVNGGLTVAITFGVPLGAVLGAVAGWRATFACVAAIAAVASMGLVFGLPRSFGAHLKTATLRERLAVAKAPAVLIALVISALWSMGTYVVYTYLALYLAATTQATTTVVGLALFSWGVASALGLYVGGRMTDRLGSKAVQIPALAVMTLAFLGLSAIPATVSGSAAIFSVFVAVIAWGAAAWAFNPAQQARMVGLAGVSVASVVLSLNASFMYLGFSLGAALGSMVIAHGSAVNLGWAAALCSAAALLLLLGSSRRGEVAAVSTRNDGTHAN